MSCLPMKLIAQGIITFLLVACYAASVHLLLKGSLLPECEQAKDELGLSPQNLEMSPMQSKTESLVIPHKNSVEFMIPFRSFTLVDKMFKMPRGSRLFQYHLLPGDWLSAKMYSQEPGAAFYVLRGCKFSHDCANGELICDSRSLNKDLTECLEKDTTAEIVNHTKSTRSHIRRSRHIKKKSGTVKLPEIVIPPKIQDSFLNIDFFLHVRKSDLYIVIIKHNGPAAENYIRLQLTLNRTGYGYIASEEGVEYCNFNRVMIYIMFFVAGLLVIYTVANVIMSYRKPQRSVKVGKRRLLGKSGAFSLKLIRSPGNISDVSKYKKKRKHPRKEETNLVV